MKIIQGAEYASGMNGTSTDICIDVVAKTDDETQIILERTLRYAVNTENLDWREQAITNLKLQRAEFEADAQRKIDMDNKIINISVDVAKVV